MKESEGDGELGEDNIFLSMTGREDNSVYVKSYLLSNASLIQSHHTRSYSTLPISPKPCDMAPYSAYRAKEFTSSLAWLQSRAIDRLNH